MWGENRLTPEQLIFESFKGSKFKRQPYLPELSLEIGPLEN